MQLGDIDERQAIENTTSLLSRFSIYSTTTGKMGYFRPYNITALDHLLMPAYVHFFLSFRTVYPEAAITTLERGVSRLVSELPFLSGTIVRTDSDATKSNILQLLPPDESFLHQHPIFQVRLHEGYISQVRSLETLREDLIPVPDTTPTPFPAPALRFQVNSMRDGVVLCVCWHHCLMDGIGCAATVESLARCCRDPSGEIVELLPNMTTQEAVRRQIEELTTSMGPIRDVRQVYGPHDYRFSDVQITRNVVLDPRRVQALTRMCNDSRPTSPDEQNERLTNDDVVSTVIWICAARARVLSSNITSSALQTCSLTRYVNVRGLLQPSAPTSYLGNAIAIARSHCILEDLGLDKPDVLLVNGQLEVTQETISRLRYLGKEIRSAANSIDLGHVKRIITELSRSSDWSSHILRPADLSISSLRQLPLMSWTLAPSWVGFKM